MTIRLLEETKTAHKEKRRQKFGAVGVHDPEHGFFHSKREHRRFFVLRLREKAGEIRNLKRQVPYALNVNGQLIGKIIMDYTYDEMRQSKVDKAVDVWVFVDEDCKGYQTDLSKWQHKLFKAVFGREIRLS